MQKLVHIVDYVIKVQFIINVCGVIQTYSLDYIINIYNVSTPYRRQALQYYFGWAEKWQMLEGEKG